MVSTHPFASDNIAYSLRLGASRHPDRVALQMHGGTFRTYAQLAERSAKIAAALLVRGLAKGDRVAIWADTRLEYLDVYLACAQAGLVVAPINARFKGREASVILDDSGAAALFYSGNVEGLLPQALSSSQVRLAVCFDEPVMPHMETFEDLLAGTEMLDTVEAGGDDLFILGYTSGTTGVPKGAMLTHATVRNLGQTNALACRYALESIQVFGLSLSFSATVPSHILPHLYVGGTTVLLPRWDTEQVLAAVEEHAATFLIVPSPVVAEFAAAVCRKPEQIRSLVSVLHSASKVPLELLQRLHQGLGPRLVEGWGMTENSGGLLTATTARDLSAPGCRALETVGRPVPDSEVAVLDDFGKPLPHDGRSVGQLAARSSSLARGYWHRPSATAAAFRDGWYLTGDMGTIDPDGYVRLIDRRSDMINSGGMNIYPSELEAVLREVPGVKEAVVVAVPHPRWGQAPAAFVQVTDPALTESDIQSHCANVLAGFKRPIWVRSVDEFPTNASGKIVRHRLTTPTG